MDQKKANSGQDDSSIAIAAPEMPKGGGSLGYAESFRANPFTGSATLSVPFPLPQARANTPDWSLAYSSDNRNGAFGFGFSVTVPAITMRLSSGIPRYDGKEVYTLETGEVLTPRFDQVNGKWVAAVRTVDLDGVSYRVTGYRKVVESSFDQIEHWLDLGTGLSFWQLTDSNNGVTTYGRTANAQIADPDNPTKICTWLAEEEVDNHGNRVVYEYKPEDDAGLTPPASAYNSSANRYPWRFRYGNYLDKDSNEQFAFQVIFDYGERDLDHPTIAPQQSWAVRNDPFSSFRSGFEVRTNRICQGVLIANQFPSELGAEPTITNVLRFEYDTSQAISLLQKVQRTGFRTDGGTVRQKPMPALTLAYVPWEPEKQGFLPLEVFPQAGEPGIVGTEQIQMVDLYAEGLPGILATQGPMLNYWRPEGDGVYAPGQPPPQFPIQKPTSDRSAALMDIGGNGALDLVVTESGQAGYYPNNNDGTWQPFRPLQSVPTALADPKSRLVDLNGNGLADLLSGNVSQWCVVQGDGAIGFKDPAMVDAPLGIEAFNPDSETVFVGFADIFGDGLSHLVRVSSGRVQVWPCLGYGHFGLPRDVMQAPMFGSEVGVPRILLADVSGSGYADLILVLGNRVDVYVNKSGNSFAAPISIPIPGGFSDLGRASVADVKGIGILSVVLSQARSNASSLYLNLCGDRNPYLLSSVVNGMGATTSVAYRSSTAYALADRSAGEPWITSLAFPVQVVAEVEVDDLVTQSKLTQVYQYRDGFFDPVDRQYRGFAYVQTQNYPAINDAVWRFPKAVNTVDIDDTMEPLLSRAWNIPGSDLEGELLIQQLSSLYFSGDPNALELPDPTFEPDIFLAGGQTLRQAWRALASSQYRLEEYGVLPTGLPKETPYRITQSAFGVRMVQPIIDGRPAVFQVLTMESSESVYDCIADDPRISHKLNVEFDSLGQSVRALDVGYKRRQLPAVPLPAQAASTMQITTNGIINHLDGGYQNGSGSLVPPLQQQDGLPFHIVGTPFENRSYEVAGFTEPTPYIDYSQAQQLAETALQNSIAYGEPFTSGKLQSRLYQWEQSLYWNSDQTQVLPLQQISAQELQHHKQTASLSEALVAEVFGSKVDDALLTDQGGYQKQDSYWWAWSSVATYAPQGQFFMILTTTDPFGGIIQTTYDAYSLLSITRTDPLGRVSTIVPDYQSLSPAQITDVNQIVSESLYDPLAQIMVTCLYGTIDGNLVGDNPISQYNIIEPATTEDILADPSKYLQGAGTYFHQDLTSWVDGSGQPPHTLMLERHVFTHPQEGSPDPGDDLFGINIAYFDGMVRLVSLAQLVSGQPPYTFSNSVVTHLMASASDANWVVPHQTIFDTQGKEAALYIPYFTATPAFVARPDIGKSRYYYDALARQVEKLTPKGFLTRTSYASWSVTQWDEDDTVKESPYYIEHINDPNLPPLEKAALEKAAIFENTPLVSQLNPMAQTIQEIRSLVQEANQQPTLLYNYSWLDVQGQLTAFADPRFYNPQDPANPSYYNQFKTYDMAGNVISTRSADAGNQPLTNALSGIPLLVLFSALGDEIERWDQVGYQTSRSYNALRLLTSIYAKGNGVDQTIERNEYGDDPHQNTVNRLIKQYDGAGWTEILGYSLSEDPIGSDRKFRTDYQSTVNWNDPASVPMETETYTTKVVYNAIGNVIKTTEPNGVQVLPSYFRNEWVREMVLVPAESGTPQLVAGPFTYIASGKPSVSPFANGATTYSDYDPLTYRVTSILAKPDAGGDAFMEMGYTYDPFGNVSYCSNPTLIPGEGGNPPNGDGDYTYDSLYRLIDATGRQQVAASSVERYAQSFTYDWSNNLEKIEQTQADPWIQQMVVSNSSNHAVPSDMAAHQPVDDYFGPQGNLSTLESGAALAYGVSGRLSNATSADSCWQDFEQYDTTGMRVRKVSVQANSTIETLYIGDFITRRPLVGDSSEKQIVRVSRGGNLLALYETESGASSWRYQIEERLWSVALELDETAQILSFEEYQPYGSPAVTVNVDAGKLYRFTQKELDQNTNLYNIGLRYYIPTQGRWITPDPAGEVDGPNLFAYVTNNPVTLRDETGECGGHPGSSKKSYYDPKRMYFYEAFKFLNYSFIVGNATFDAGVTYREITKTFYMPVGIHGMEPIKSAGSGLLFSQVGLLALYGGATGMTSSVAHMYKYGVGRQNSLNLFGNALFFAEGYVLMAALLKATEHSLHHSLHLGARFGAGADFVKMTNSFMDKDYLSAFGYGLLGTGNLLTMTSTRDRARVYKRTVGKFVSNPAVSRGVMRAFIFSPVIALGSGAAIFLYKATKMVKGDSGGKGSKEHH